MEPTAAPDAKEPPRGALVWLLGLMFAFSGAASLVDARLRTRLARAAFLLNALLAFFGALVAVAPSLPQRGLLPVALFASALALFRLMAGFEPPRETT